MILRALVITMTIGASLSVQSCSSGPDNYNDCIIQNVKSGMSDHAVALVSMACREKFPEATSSLPEEARINLPPEALTNLTGRLRPSFGSNWSGNIYNGNDGWQVEKLVIRVTEPGWLRKSLPGFEDLESSLDREDDEPKAELYSVDVTIPPLSNRSFTLSVNWGRDDEYQWHVVSARGRRVGG